MLDESTKTQILERYRSGQKVSQITDELGVAKSSVYYVLNEGGAVPARRSSRSVLDRSKVDISDYPTLLDWALARVAQVEEQNADLTARLRNVAAQLLE